MTAMVSTLAVSGFAGCTPAQQGVVPGTVSVKEIELSERQSRSGGTHQISVIEPVSEEEVSRIASQACNLPKPVSVDKLTVEDNLLIEGLIVGVQGVSETVYTIKCPEPGKDTQ